MRARTIGKPQAPVVIHGEPDRRANWAGTASAAAQNDLLAGGRTAAETAAKLADNYRHVPTGLECRPRPRPPVDSSGRLAHAYGTEGGGMVGLTAALRCGASCSWGEAPVMAGQGDEITAAAGGRGRLRASHADREQVI